MRPAKYAPKVGPAAGLVFCLGLCCGRRFLSPDKRGIRFCDSCRAKQREVSAIREVCFKPGE